MRKLFNIALFCFIIALPWSALGKTNSLPSHAVAHIQPLKGSSADDTHPESNPNRLRIPHQGESGINILNRLSVPDSLNEIEDHFFNKLYDDSDPTNYTSCYFIIGQNLERSLTVKKLIFPFHSFL